jgi:hypothetical protein
LAILLVAILKNPVTVFFLLTLALLGPLLSLLRNSESRGRVSLRAA